MGKLKDVVKEKIKEELREELLEKIQKDGEGRNVHTEHKPSWAETGLKALKAWRGGASGPWWAKVLTWVPILLLISWVLYSWNQHLKQLRDAQDELDSIRRKKEKADYEAKQAALKGEDVFLEHKANKLKLEEELKLAEVKRLEKRAEEAKAMVARISDWSDVDAYWKE